MFILILNLFTIFNKLVLAFLLWFKKNNSLPNKILSLIILFPAITVLSNLLLYLKDYRFDFLVFANQVFANLMAPMIYFYCLMMIGEIKKLEKKHFAYFITAVIPIICWIYYIFFYSAEEKLAMLNSSLNAQDVLFQIMNRCIELQFITFMILSIYKVRRYKKQVVKAVSDTEKIKVQWVSQFIRLILALCVVLALAGIFFPSLVYGLIVVPILSNIFYFYIVYESFSNSVLFTKNEFESFHKELEVIKEVSEIKKPSESLNQASLEKDAQKIEQIIISKKPYLNPDLTLPMLAEMAELSLHRVSEVINNRYKQNFFEFVNCYRVKHAKELLLDPKSNAYTFESLAEECGFGSKVTFNRAFKKITGKTPTEFKKEELEKLANNYH